SRAGVSLRHLHQPGLEHDVLVLPVATDHATGIGRGRQALSPATLAALSAAGGACGDYWAVMERHDELWWRLVLCCCQRGDQCAHPVLPLAGDWLVCHHSRRGARYPRLAVCTGGHSGGHRAGGPALLAAAGGMGGPLQVGAQYCGGDATLLGTGYPPQCPSAPSPGQYLCPVA